MKEITLDLHCDLSPDELSERAQQLSSDMIRYNEIEDLKKEQTSDFNKSLSQLRIKMTENSRVIRKKAEMRPTACDVRFHCPEVGMKRTMRKDTGEFVKDEAMTIEERQANLFDDIDALNRLYRNDLNIQNEPPANQP